MYVLTEIGYVLINQVKEKEKNVVLKMLCREEQKFNKNKNNSQSKDCIYFQFQRLYLFFSKTKKYLHTWSVNVI